MTSFPDALPHGDIRSVFDNIFFVEGQILIDRGNDESIEYTRSMTIVRQGDTVVLVNPMRLNESALKEIEALGSITDIVRVAGYHGRDDAFFSERYDVPVWSLKGTPNGRPLKEEKNLAAPNTSPLKDATVFSFDSIEIPESVIVLKEHGGILITGDSFHNVTVPNDYINDYSAGFVSEAGFIGEAVIGPGWYYGQQPREEEFENLLALKFQHLLPSHGQPLLNEAHEAMAKSVKAVYKAG